jgi:hypothetical protein
VGTSIRVDPTGKIIVAVVATVKAAAVPVDPA